MKKIITPSLRLYKEKLDDIFDIYLILSVSMIVGSIVLFIYLYS